MNLIEHLPARMCCLLCFTPGAMERRTDKKGRPYFSCVLCHCRMWIYSNTHLFGLIFWSKALADGRLVAAARADLEAMLGQRTQPAVEGISLPVERHAPGPLPERIEGELPVRVMGDPT